MQHSPSTPTPTPPKDRPQDLKETETQMGEMSCPGTPRELLPSGFSTLNCLPVVTARLGKVLAVVRMISEHWGHALAANPTGQTSLAGSARLLHSFHIWLFQIYFHRNSVISL